MTNEVEAGLLPTGLSGRIEMRTPDEVSAILALRACGWGTKRVAAELGCSRNTVRRWLAEGVWRAAKPADRTKALDGLEAWPATPSCSFQRQRWSPRWPRPMPRDGSRKS